MITWCLLIRVWGNYSSYLLFYRNNEIFKDVMFCNFLKSQINMHVNCTASQLTRITQLYCIYIYIKIDVVEKSSLVYLQLD